MATQDTTVTQLIFNKMSQAKYEELKAAGQLNENEFYITPEELDTVPTSGSANAITSGAVFDAIATLEAADTTNSNATAKVAEDLATLTGNVYTKTEVDNKIAEKDSLPAQADNAGKFLTTDGTSASWETIQATDEEFAAGTSTTKVVTVKQAVDALALKADQATTYTKTEVDNALALKADKATTYTKTEVDGLVSPKADKTYVDEELAKKADKATTLAGYGIGDAYTKDEVDAKVASVYRFKGSVANEAALPAEGNVVGDVYNVEDTGSNYAWDGSAWDKLSETVDLTPYLTKADAQTTYETIANVALKADKATTYTKTEVDTLFDEYDAFPVQTDNAGKILATNGTNVEWVDPTTITIRTWTE